MLFFHNIDQCDVRNNNDIIHMKCDLQPEDILYVIFNFFPSKGQCYMHSANCHMTKVFYWGHTTTPRHHRFLVLSVRCPQQGMDVQYWSSHCWWSSSSFISLLSPQPPWSRWPAPWPRWSCLTTCVTWCLHSSTLMVSVCVCVFIRSLFESGKQEYHFWDWYTDGILSIADHHSVK